ncbi:MAG: hypothetical protein ABI723_12385 [Bacteroidia bacterium]
MNDKFSTLDGHIEKLIHLHQQTVIENKKLVELNSSLKSKIEEQNKKLLQVGEELKTAKSAQVIEAVGETEDKQALKNNITKYISEIDRCLAMLNR